MKETVVEEMMHIFDKDLVGQDDRETIESKELRAAAIKVAMLGKDPTGAWFHARHSIEAVINVR